MQKFLQKFDEQYKGKKYIEIEFASDNPLTKKYVRYNQSGEVCYCLDGNNTGSQKIQNGWKPIECNIEQCQYRQKNAQGKTACNRIGWLKFFIPSICQDRIWLMKITGQTSIDRLDTYINLQKSKGNSLNGKYILFLKQEKQISKITGETYNNYILDIVKKEDFIQTNQIPQTTEKQKELSTKNTENVNNNVVKQEPTETNVEATTTATTSTKQNENDKPKEKASKKTSTSKETTKKGTKSKTKKSEDKKQDENKPKEESKTEDDNLKDCYALLKTFTETIANKEYLIGEFADMKDKISNIVIRPEDAAELENCDLGTFVKLDILEKGGRKFAMKLEFIEKMLKKVAA